MKNTNTTSHDPIYTPENISLFETVYGKNLISLGGFAAIDNMFSDIDLTGLNILDVGFGLGGVAFYLAEKYQTEVVGIEVHDWMVEYAKSHAPDRVRHLLNFVTYNDENHIPFENNVFDLVYSKGVLNHVRDKHNLFQKINRVLKADGLFVIADWIYPASVQKNNSEFLVHETQETYREILTNAGFGEIDFRDDSQVFISYVKTLIENVTRYREFIEKKFGEEIFSKILQDHEKLIDDVKCQRRFAVRIKARKSM